MSTKTVGALTLIAAAVVATSSALYLELFAPVTSSDIEAVSGSERPSNPGDEQGTTPTPPGMEFPGDEGQRTNAETSDAARIAGSKHVLRIISENLERLPIARLRHEDRWIDADSNGEIEIWLEHYPTQVIVEAPGYQSQQEELDAYTKTVVLHQDSGLEVTVVWRGVNSPVALATISLLLLPKDEGWTLEGVMPKAHYTTNAEGKATLFGVWAGHMRPTLIVSHQEAVETIVARAAWAYRPRRGDPKPLRLVLSRENKVRFRIIDALGIGRPLVPVEMRVGGHRLSGRTDEDGFAEFGYHVAFLDEPGAKESIDHIIWTQLDEERTWVLAASSTTPANVNGQRFRERYAAIKGGLRSRPTQELEVATAFAESSSPEDWYHYFPSAQNLAWTRVSEAGSFEVNNGWQGYKTCLVFREAKTKQVVGAHLVERGRRQECEVLELCVVEVRNESRSNVLWLKSIDNSAAKSRRFDLTTGRLLLNRGEYEVKNRVGSSWIGLPRLDASGLTAEYTVPTEPTLRHVGGTVSGSITGPASGKLVQVNSEAGMSSTRTALDGSFSMSVVASGETELRIADPHDPLWGEHVLRLGSADSRHLDIVRKEGRVTFARNYSAAQLDPGIRAVLERRVKNSQWKGIWGRRIPKTGITEFILPIGRYRVREELIGETLMQEVFELAEGEVRDFTVPASEKIAVSLAFRIEKESPLPRSFAIRIQNGSRVILEEEFSWDNGLAEVRFDLFAGAYEYTILWDEEGDSRGPLRGLLDCRHAQDYAQTIYIPKSDE